MRMRVLCLFMMLMVTAAHAQRKPAYTASTEVNWLKGNNGSTTAFFFTNGVQYKTWSAGLGAGIDNYLIRSIPLFIDVRKDFGRHSLQPFIDYAAGINVNAIKEEQRQVVNVYQNTDIKNGFFMKTSVGASVKLDKKLRLYAGFGYCYKTTKVNYDIYNYIPEQQVDRGSDLRRMNRWSLTIGIRF